jgi:Domain of unknown function (DUF4397)
MRYTNSLKILAITSFGLGLIACDNASDRATLQPSFDLQVVHASADAPAVNVELGSSEVATGLGFKEATPVIRYRGAGMYSVAVNAIVPGGTATVIGPADLTFEADTTYQIVAVGDAANIEPLVIANPTSPVPGTAARVQVVHGAFAAPAVDVYVTAPGALLGQSAPLATLAFKENAGPVEVPLGDYQVRVTLPGDPGSVVFDSGTIGLIGGANLLVVAVDNTGPGTAPISLVVADGSGASEIQDGNTPAEVRVIHASPDAPPVDVVLDDDFASPVLESVPFPAASGYLAVAAGAHNVKVTAENNPGAIVIDAGLMLAAGTRYSVYAAGLLANIEPFVLVDDPRPIATEARVRVIHLAPSAGLVDLYVTAPGTDINNETPAFSNVDFKAETGYVALAAGDYDVTVTVAGTKVAAIGPLTISIDNGGVYTAVARDATGGGAPFGATLLDDFN